MSEWFSKVVFLVQHKIKGEDVGEQPFMDGKLFLNIEHHF